MSADIRVDISFRTHPKRVKLQKRLGAPGVLAYIDLLLFAGDSKPDGVFKGMTPEDIALAAQWSGDEKAFISTLVSVGLLEKKGEVYALHNWRSRNAYAANAESRKFASGRAAHIRWLKERGIPCQDKRCKYCGPHAGRIGRQRKRNPPVPAPPPAPAPAHTTRAREAADAWNAQASALKRKPVTGETIASLSSRAEEVTTAILELRPEFTWAGCIARIQPSSWLVREAASFSFEWLFKRDQHRTEWNAIKVWDGRLGAAEEGSDSNSDFDSEGRLRRMVL